ncbi:MAG: hypothetical protein LRZ85_04030 [Alphaproteobacteria bacterium]|nr:hypothetical protein [Alphaproteobacteria bacterium]MCD8520376.1 hypothetical protein [Alphaproteobacteria bacterium]MCD8526302.1 hypothetical protein [Alphaproteobacteria bacterium]MCD8570064.1 hypothetical protein [Alphaproteobacteria bacterium]
MSDDKQDKLKRIWPKAPPVELDTDMPEPENVSELPAFLHSSPSFRRVFYGTTGAMLLALAGTAYIYFNGPDQKHNPVLNGTAEKLFPELRR